MSEVTEYLAKIGAEGGRKRKHHPKRSQLAKRAAQSRWQNAKRLSMQKKYSQPQNSS